MKKRLCLFCEKPLKKIGKYDRKNGKDSANLKCAFDWENRKFHKKCVKNGEAMERYEATQLEKLNQQFEQLLSENK